MWRSALDAREIGEFTPLPLSAEWFKSTRCPMLWDISAESSKVFIGDFLPVRPANKVRGGKLAFFKLAAFDEYAKCNLNTAPEFAAAKKVLGTNLNDPRHSLPLTPYEGALHVEESDQISSTFCDVVRVGDTTNVFVSSQGKLEQWVLKLGANKWERPQTWTFGALGQFRVCRSAKSWCLVTWSGEIHSLDADKMKPIWAGRQVRLLVRAGSDTYAFTDTSYFKLEATPVPRPFEIKLPNSENLVDYLPAIKRACRAATQQF